MTGLGGSFKVLGGSFADWEGSIKGLGDSFAGLRGSLTDGEAVSGLDADDMSQNTQTQTQTQTHTQPPTLHTDTVRKRECRT